MCKVKKQYRPNSKDWAPSINDYVLVFIPVDGIWIEVGHDIPCYRNITLADYLNIIGITIPDWTQFIRIIDEERGFYIEYRCYGSMRVSIRFIKRL